MISLRPPIVCLVLFLISALTSTLADAAAATVQLSKIAAPGGSYRLDPKHTNISFSISHLGFSSFIGRFDHADANYDFDPEAPEKSMLDVTVYPTSIDTNADDLDDALRGANWFDTLKFPRATFHATHIAIIGTRAATITGDFTLHGETHNLILNVTMTGGGISPVDEAQVMGFHATGHFSRSDYGISNLVPMVGDDVSLDINCEFDKE